MYHFRFMCCLELFTHLGGGDAKIYFSFKLIRARNICLIGIIGFTILLPKLRY